MAVQCRICMMKVLRQCHNCQHFLGIHSHLDRNNQIHLDTQFLLDMVQMTVHFHYIHRSPEMCCYSKYLHFPIKLLVHLFQDTLFLICTLVRINLNNISFDFITWILRTLGCVLTGAWGLSGYINTCTSFLTNIKRWPIGTAFTDWRKCGTVAGISIF